MNFYDKIQEMDYVIKQHTPNCIVIESKQEISDKIIIFDIKNKKLMGYLKPNDLLGNLDDISHQYTLFRQLQEDLKELENLSKYTIAQ